MTIVLREEPLRSEPGETLDPQNWDELRAQGHRMLDDMFDYIANIRERPVWSPIPDDIRGRFRSELPLRSSDLTDVYREFTDCVVPYVTGNVHPGFMGWVHGGAGASCAPTRHWRERRVADRLYVESRAWLYQQGHGYRGLWP
jgi:aromatic-L-amino-acid decarboxylase